MADEDTNEIVAAARDAKRAAQRAAERARDLPLGAIGLGIGIGSAALAAALLYASRARVKREQ